MKQADLEAACELAGRMMSIIENHNPEVVRLSVFVVIKAFRATYGSQWEDTLVKCLEDAVFEFQQRASH